MFFKKKKLDLKDMLIKLSIFFGRRVSLTADGQTLIVGIPNHNNHLFVCSLEESDYTKLTQDVVDSIIVGYNEYNSETVEEEEDES